MKSVVSWPKCIVSPLVIIKLNFYCLLNETVESLWCQLFCHWLPNNLLYCSYRGNLWNSMHSIKQGKSEGFDICNRPSNLKLDSNHWFFCLCDREIWWMTLKNNRALLYYVMLNASFQIHWWFQTGVTVWKCWIRVQIGDILSHVTLKFHGWPW